MNFVACYQKMQEIRLYFVRTCLLIEYSSTCVMHISKKKYALGQGLRNCYMA